jgi:hypothetical protein
VADALPSAAEDALPSAGPDDFSSEQQASRIKLINQALRIRGTSGARGSHRVPHTQAAGAQDQG